MEEQNKYNLALKHLADLEHEQRFLLNNLAAAVAAGNNQEILD